ncbi:MAG: glycosyltransferase [Patescibacteria group bacterium]|nr:glycosyltransferase [Patescibacteria group bacterium]
MISIIVPAYNEKNTIEDTIKTLRDYFNSQGERYELVVVSDGSVDRTYDVAKELEDDYVRVFSYQNNQGKGHALKYGFGKSQGDQIVFFDAGLDFPPEQITDFLGLLNSNGADMIIGSKRHPDSTVSYPWHRRLVSFAAQTLVRLLFNLNVTDTQVGIKAFRREVLEKIMPLVLVKRYAFDIELLALAHHYGYSIMEAPVKLDLKISTAVSPRSLKNCLLDTLAVFYRLKILGYYDLSYEDRQEMLDKYPVTTVDKVASFILGDLLTRKQSEETS